MEKLYGAPFITLLLIVLVNLGDAVADELYLTYDYVFINHFLVRQQIGKAIDTVDYFPS
ncbi:hypothetical protein H1Q63_35210 [Desmonostoc muscorum CCALA 125]|nr:hypothetical protein [Desmonostoc muscorum CCALA 125]